jgi:hypothetical protein
MEEFIKKVQSELEEIERKEKEDRIIHEMNKNKKKKPGIFRSLLSFLKK